MATGDLSSESETFIAGEIALGTYRSRGDALEAAISLLRKRKELLERLDEGRRQLDAGNFVDFDEAGLRQFFDGLKEHAHKRAEAK